MSTGQKSDSQNFLRKVALRVWLGIKGRAVHAPILGLPESNSQGSRGPKQKPIFSVLRFLLICSTTSRILRWQLGKKLENFRAFKRRFKQEALVLIAALLLKKTHLLFRLNTLGHREQI
jgi:hypothetical protein